jgi:hypothetical protein
MPPPPIEISDALVWSCCRLNCGSPFGMTVGTVTPMRKALRPGAGSVSSACRSSTPPVDAVDVSISGD